MKCNQKFFGQEHFERGSTEREFCSSLGTMKPAMLQYGFALRDRLPQLPSDASGLVQVKYNGMLSVVIWDDKRAGFVAFGHRGRCYYSLVSKKHPVTEYFNERFKFRDLAFVGETYAIRRIHDKCYMTEFNKSMSIIKNPRSIEDVERIRLAVFDYAQVGKGRTFNRTMDRYIDRFKKLQYDYRFPVGCDSGAVHLPDYLATEGSFQNYYAETQAFWNEFIGERGFEGLVMHTSDGEEYKIKFRDTLDVVIIAFRKTGNSRPVCRKCGAKFDVLWLRKLAREGSVERSHWFDQKGRLLENKKGNDVWGKNLDMCPVCGGSVSNTAGPILGAKIALMTPNGDFVDIADGMQLSPISPILDLLEPLYETEDYLWVKPAVVVEVSYQDLYLERLRPVYRFEMDRYVKVGVKKAVSLRPYRPRLRDDKAATPRDLRLEQVSYYVKRARRIEEGWRKMTRQRSLSEYA